MCGESLKVFAGETITAGSPPHVWGKLVEGTPGKGGYRITPTCVGKAAFSLSSRYAPKDHPHMCGESNTYVPYVVVPVGSPPHVWGKLIHNGC